MLGPSRFAGRFKELINYGIQATEWRENMKFVIIGGDAAGMSAASRAKRKQPKLDVTVLEQTGDVSYSA